MLKQLRNLLILVLLLGGLVKLVLWQRASAELSNQLNRISGLAQIGYEGVSAGFDGSITLSKVRILPAAGPYRSQIDAEKIVLQTPGLLWLLKRSLGISDEFPESLDLTIEGLSLPDPAATYSQSWFNPLSTVPFETFGCGTVVHFSAADYERMSMTPLRPTQRASYRYSRAEGELAFDLRFVNPPVSQFGATLVVSRLSPLVLSGVSTEPIEIKQLDLNYVDSGFLGPRNQFCAQSLGTSPVRFVERHIEAVMEWFAARGMRPAGELVGLYRRLVGNGGAFLVRNGTALVIRLDDLASLAPNELIARLKMQAQLDELAPRPLKIDWLSEASPEASVQGPVFDAEPDATATVPDEVDTRTEAEIALTELRAMFKPPELPPQVIEQEYIANEPEAVESEEPDPVVALVTKKADPGVPEIERLPPRVVRPTDYHPVAYDDLAIHIGKRVRLVTLVGKRHVGTVEAVDENGVQLRVNLTSGHVLYLVPKSNLREILLLKQ